MCKIHRFSDLPFFATLSVAVLFAVPLPPPPVRVAVSVVMPAGTVKLPDAPAASTVPPPEELP